MRLAKVQTIRLAEFPNLLLVQLHADEGMIGLGETYFNAQAAEARSTRRLLPICWERIGSG